MTKVIDVNFKPAGNVERPETFTNDYMRAIWQTIHHAQEEESYPSPEAAVELGFRITAIIFDIFCQKAKSKEEKDKLFRAIQDMSVRYQSYMRVMLKQSES